MSRSRDPAAEAFRRLVEMGRPIAAPGIRAPISAFLGFQRVRGAAVRKMIVEHHKASFRKMLSMTTPAAVLRGQGRTSPWGANTPYVSWT